MNITEISKDACTGCGLCTAVCPKSAIAMVADGEGFLYPRCSVALCINCGICLQECPSRIELPMENTPKFYEAKAKENSVRKASTSGGIFSLLAQKVLEAQGCVYGAGFEDGSCRVVHRRADNMTELRALSDSKYVQSRIDPVFALLQKDLEARKMVLFSGTPCQVHAVRQFAEKRKFSEKLLLCDIVCHGCPSPAIYEEHLAFLEKKYKMNIASVKFRDKEYGWSKSCQRILKATSTEGTVFQDTSYYQLYFSYGVLSRPVCEKCRYCTPNRVSDITLGDFWGCQALENDELGISLLVTNTEKGKRALSDIREHVVLAESSMDVASRENIHLKQPSVSGPWRKPFWSAYHLFGYEKTLKIFTDRRVIPSILRRIVVRFWK